jgi:hypothetical protein
MALPLQLEKQQTPPAWSDDASASLAVLLLLMLSVAFWGLAAVLLFRVLA